jgi:disulfide bond formation protein DsbB
MITIPATIAAMPILNKMAGSSKSSAPLLAMLMSIAGLIVSVFTFQIVNNDTPCEKVSSEKSMAIAGMVLSIVAILGSGGALFYKNKNAIRARMYPVAPLTQGGAF